MLFNGALIKRFRNELGLSQEKLSEISGVSRVTISLLETGQQTSTEVGTLLKLAAALKREPSEFFLNA